MEINLVGIVHGIVIAFFVVILLGTIAYGMITAFKISRSVDDEKLKRQYFKHLIWIIFSLVVEIILAVVVFVLIL